MATGEVAEATTDRQPRDPRGRYEAQHGGQAVQLRLAIDITERATGLRAGDLPRRIDPHPAQQRHVDHQAAFAHRQPRDVVATATHGVQNPVLAREANGLHHVGRAGAARNQSGAAIDHRVPDLACVLVSRVVRSEQLALERRFERLQRVCSDAQCPAVESCELDRHRCPLRSCDVVLTCMAACQRQERATSPESEAMTQ